ncbi:MAG: class I SAM-dependent methyltransferase [Pseudomonadota bacterium]|nr:class I SAM-dependent methyltransferase [Pseudomonadota bacterium]
MNPWDLRYGEPEPAYGYEPNEFLRAMAEKIPPGPVLCLAEGQGRNAVWLASQGWEVTAIDASSVGMESARRLARARGVLIETIVADLSTWEGPHGHWAGIVAIFGHFPAPVRERVHRAIPSWLRPGGVLLLEAYRPEQLQHGIGGPPDLRLLYTLEQLAADFAELEIERLEAVDREVREGRYHTGSGAVVQLVARRSE